MGSWEKKIWETPASHPSNRDPGSPYPQGGEKGRIVLECSPPPQTSPLCFQLRGGWLSPGHCPETNADQLSCKLGGGCGPCPDLTWTCFPAGLRQTLCFRVWGDPSARGGQPELLLLGTQGIQTVPMFQESSRTFLMDAPFRRMAILCREMSESNMYPPSCHPVSWGAQGNWGPQLRVDTLHPLGPGEACLSPLGEPLPASSRYTSHRAPLIGG